MIAFAAPAALLLLLPVAGGAAALWRSARGGGRLPGDWARLVAPPLRAALARAVAGRDRSRLLAAAATAICLAVSLSGPSVERGGGTYADLVGRVIVLDLPPGSDPGPMKRAAERLISLAPETQTALVAVSADAFDVTPLTFDPAPLRRYLLALSPAIMPTAGRNPAAGLLQAEAALDRAGVIVRQVVLFAADGPAPQSVRLPPPTSGLLRAVVTTAPAADGWAETARSWDADLLTPESLPTLNSALARARDAARRRIDAEQGASLAPWFIGLAALFWLGMFRRRSNG